MAAEKKDKKWYKEVYLASPHWQELRKEALKAARHRCSCCNSRLRLEVHHLTYKNLGSEGMLDLRVLCFDCHKLAHGKKTLLHKKKPKVLYLPPDPRLFYNHSYSKARRKGHTIHTVRSFFRGKPSQKPAACPVGTVQIKHKHLQAASQCTNT